MRLRVLSFVLMILVPSRREVNFNYLLDGRTAKRKCIAEHKTCYFVPAGTVRAVQGNNIYLSMRCRNCGKREDVFLSREEYFTQQKLIEKELANV